MVLSLNQIQAAKPDKLILKAGGQRLEGWETVSVHRELGAIAGQFSIGTTDRFIDDDSKFPLAPGLPVEIFLNDDKVMTGFIDRIEFSFSPEGRNVRVSGRDKTGELVDNSADITNSNILKQPFNKVLESLCAPFSVKVVDNVGSFKPLENTTPNQGDTVASVIDRLARHQGATLVTSEKGELVITKLAESNSHTDLVQGENVLSATASYDETDRFKTYSVRSPQLVLDATNGQDTANVVGEAMDNGVSRSFRKKIIIGESAMSIEQAKIRAQWEAKVAAGRALQVECMVQGWRQGNGQLWKLNQVVGVDLNYALLKEDLLVTGIEFQKSNSSGSTTRLVMTRKDAFKPEPVVREEKIVRLEKP